MRPVKSGGPASAPIGVEDFGRSGRADVTMFPLWRRALSPLFGPICAGSCPGMPMLLPPPGPPRRIPPRFLSKTSGLPLEDLANSLAMSSASSSIRAAAILSRSSSVKSGRLIAPKAPQLSRVAEPEFWDMREGGRIGALETTFGGGAGCPRPLPGAPGWNMGDMPDKWA